MLWNFGNFADGYGPQGRLILATNPAASSCHVTAAWTSVVAGDDSIRFTASDTNSTATHVFNFGDGTTASGSTSTIHHYAASGTYNVCFYSSMPGTACRDSLCRTVTVTGTIPCHLTAAWTSVVAGDDSIRFTASDTNSTATHIFNFGDGTSASGSTDTIHHYAAPGTYHVCFYSSIPGTACSDSLCLTVTVTGTIPCHVTAAWTSVVAGDDSIRFTASDTNSAATHVFNFGDGTTASGSIDTIHHYAAPGTYHVCFYSSIPGTACSDSLCQDMNIISGISELLQPEADVAVMPNPFSGHVVIRIGNMMKQYELNIYSLLGDRIRHSISEANIFDLATEDFSSGMYMYEILFDHNVIAKGKMISE